LLTAIRAESSNTLIHYHSVEKFPLEENLHVELNYPALPELKGTDSLYSNIVKAPWNEEVEISPYFLLKKIKGDAFDETFEPAKFDLVYFDAFGARAQEEMWEDEIFRIMAELMKPGAVLVTYAAKGSARRAMIKAGLKVEKIPGAPGKREMMRAYK
jgi:tRNA U34 5-methylaminomethyl-2-thiouridine-forming methyltransferase MnmC